MLLFHHDPLHSDSALDALAEGARASWRELGGTDGALELAVEGGELEVTGVDAAATTRS